MEFQNQIIFSNSYNKLVEYLKIKGEKLTLNEQTAFLLLSYGFVFEDITITNEIKRLFVGHCATIHNGNLELEKFYSLSNTPKEISEDDSIDKIDKYFKESLRLAFEKNREYGYTHIA